MAGAKTEVFNHNKLNKKRRGVLVIEWNAFGLNNADNGQKMGMELRIYLHIFRMKYNSRIVALQCSKLLFKLVENVFRRVEEEGVIK